MFLGNNYMMTVNVDGKFSQEFSITDTDLRKWGNEVYKKSKHCEIALYKRISQSEYKLVKRVKK